MESMAMNGDITDIVLCGFSRINTFEYVSFTVGCSQVQ